MEFARSWVEPDLGVPVWTSEIPHSGYCCLGPDVLCYSSSSDSAFSPQGLRPDLSYLVAPGAPTISLAVGGPPPAFGAGDLGSVPGWGRPPGEGNGNPFQYSYLDDSMDRGAWWDIVHGVAKSWT